MVMCCACGGGQEDDSTPGPNPNPDGDGDCVDSNEVDPWGLGCEYYAENTEWCDEPFPDDMQSDLLPWEDCCACGGGDSGDDTTPGPSPVPDETGECEDSTALDPWDLGCDYYTEHTEWCDEPMG